ncbi:helix-turn-helix transcriptional regulator [Marmoricola sp. URHB0036]|uniref:ArsR/SmtB family transcription factor n=1 Tax=Marmoricola sp. URHB0036 TaxID=1298863 RepID=UPI0003F702AC|nr:metalloregulator ArsR/SmtB family transcription factor [Marmoricola sp. URHB0036]
MENTLWAALVDPNRRAVLDLLAQGELSVNELVERLGLTQPQTSKHLRVLREAGLVRVDQQAQRRIYAVEPAPMAELDEWLAPYRRLWNTSLDRLGAHLDKDLDKEK